MQVVFFDGRRGWAVVQFADGRLEARMRPSRKHPLDWTRASASLALRIYKEAFAQR